MVKENWHVQTVFWHYICLVSCCTHTNTHRQHENILFLFFYCWLVSQKIIIKWILPWSKNRITISFFFPFEIKFESGFNYIRTYSSLHFKRDLELLKHRKFLKDCVRLLKLYCVLFYKINMRSWGQRTNILWFTLICFLVSRCQASGV